MRHGPTWAATWDLNCGNAFLCVATKHQDSGRFGAPVCLRIRRLGVRIPSGALCVETDDGPPASGNAAGGLLVSDIRMAPDGGVGPKMGPKIRRRALKSAGLTLGSWTPSVGSRLAGKQPGGSFSPAVVATRTPARFTT